MMLLVEGVSCEKSNVILAPSFLVRFNSSADSFSKKENESISDASHFMVLDEVLSTEERGELGEDLVTLSEREGVG